MPPLRSDGNLIFHTVEKATLLNKYFAQMSSISKEPYMYEPGSPSLNNENLLELFITEEEVGDKLFILTRILKGISTSIKIPLTKLFNISLSLRKLRDLWKIAQEAAYYKDILLAGALCKLMEKKYFFKTST